MAKSPQPKLSGHKRSGRAPALPASPLYTTTAGDRPRTAEVADQFSPTSSDPRSRRVKYASRG